MISLIDQQYQIFRSLYNQLEDILSETRQKVESEVNLNTDTEREGELTNLSNSINSSIDNINSFYDKISEHEDFFLEHEEDIVNKGNGSAYYNSQEKLLELFEFFEKYVYQLEDNIESSSLGLALEQTRLTKLVGTIGFISYNANSRLSRLTKSIDSIDLEFKKLELEEKRLATKKKVVAVKTAYQKVLDQEKELVEQQEELMAVNEAKEEEYLVEQTKLEELEKNYVLQKAKFKSNLERLEELRVERQKSYSDSRQKLEASLKSNREKAEKLKEVSTEDAYDLAVKEMSEMKAK